MMTSTERNRVWRAENPERARESTRLSQRRHRAKSLAERPAQFLAEKRLYKIQRRYGLTQFDYEELLQAQECSCAICFSPFTQTPHVDHCHTTGAIRGLLCSFCNTAIGKLREDPALIRRAADYVESHSAS